MRKFGFIRILSIAAIVLAGVCPALPAAETKGGGRNETKPAPRKPAVEKKVELKPQAAEKEALPKIAHVRLAGPILASPPDFSLFVGQSSGMTLRDWLQRLAKIRNDERIQSVAMEIGNVGMNWSQARELADAIRRLNQTKPVHAHLIGGSAVQFLVASAAKEVTMDPAGTLMITGIGAELTFFRGTLDWIGVEPQLIQVGRFKGAAEPFTRTGPSPELKGEYEKILDDLYGQLCQQIATQRRLTVPHVQQVIDNGPIDAPEALEFRFVDRLVARADWRDHVVARAAGKKHKGAEWMADYGRKKAKAVDFSNPLALFGMMFGGPRSESVQDPTIAIIHADGMIVEGSSGQGMFGGGYVGADTMTKCFDQVRKDEKIKAVIFRINSPGGSAMASELIYQSVKKCSEAKPVIVSVSGLAGSGGYYIAMGGRKILADAPAIVGSVGVISGKMAMSGLMEKLGVSTFEITRGQNAGLWMSRRWTGREEAAIRKLSARTYDLFVSRVKESRGRRVKDIDAVTQGRIFTAQQAVKNGMIDEIGGLREAVLAAQTAAGVKSSYFITLPRPKTLADMFSGADTSAAAPRGPAEMLEALGGKAPSLLAGVGARGGALAYMLSLAQVLGTDTVLTAMPYHVSVHP